MEEKVCPVIMDLSSPDSMDDFRPEAVAVSVLLSIQFIASCTFAAHWIPFTQFRHNMDVSHITSAAMVEPTLMKDMGSEMWACRSTSLFCLL